MVESFLREDVEKFNDYDSVCFLLNELNSLSLRSIFTEKLDNWKELKNENLP